MKSIYTFYKERLIEVSGKNRSIYAKTISKKNGYDLGRIMSCDIHQTNELLALLWSGRHTAFPLISRENISLRVAFGLDEKERLMLAELKAMDASKQQTEKARFAKQLKAEFDNCIEKEINSLTILKREIDDIEKETGRYELFLGYPYVLGNLKDTQIKAPLLFFPVEIEIIDDHHASICAKATECVLLNKALIYAYAQAKRIDVKDLITEFDNLTQKENAGLDNVIANLKKFGIKLNTSSLDKGMSSFSALSDPKTDSLTLSNACMLGRFPLANSIYNDYSELEKQQLTNEAVDQLLNTRTIKQQKREPDANHYIISDLDFAQRRVVEQVSSAGNMVSMVRPVLASLKLLSTLYPMQSARAKK